LRIPLSSLRVFTDMMAPIALLDPILTLHLVSHCIQMLRNLYNRIHNKLDNLASMEAHRELSAMKHTEDRKERDVRAIQWLVNN
jgi:hypothetical protein